MTSEILPQGHIPFFCFCFLFPFLSIERRTLCRTMLASLMGPPVSLSHSGVTPGVGRTPTSPPFPPAVLDVPSCEDEMTLCRHVIGVV